MSELKAQLAQYINDLAVQRGEFTLTSGKKASFYIDLRQVSLDHRVAPMIGDVMLDVVSEFPDAQLVGGLTMGADPIASAIMHRAVIAGRSLDAFVVRKEPKGHGMGKQVEGPDVSGKKVIVVEDTSTTGGSPLKAIEAVEKAGGIVVAVAVVVDRDTGAKQVIEEAGYPYRAALGLADLGLA
ncbi:MAG: orotate phosphoribosyltransferase [Pontimonas sp.]